MTSTTPTHAFVAVSVTKLNLQKWSWICFLYSYVNVQHTVIKKAAVKRRRVSALKRAYVRLLRTLKLITICTFHYIPANLPVNAGTIESPRWMWQYAYWYKEGLRCWNQKWR